MKERLEEVVSQLEGLQVALDTLDESNARAEVNEHFYYKKLQNLATERAELLMRLRSLLDSEGWSLSAEFIASICEARNASDLDASVTVADKASKESQTDEGWIDSVREAVNERRGPVVRLVVSLALRVAKWAVDAV